MHSRASTQSNVEERIESASDLDITVIDSVVSPQFTSEESVAQEPLHSIILDSFKARIGMKNELIDRLENRLTDAVTQVMEQEQNTIDACRKLVHADENSDKVEYLQQKLQENRALIEQLTRENQEKATEIQVLNVKSGSVQIEKLNEDLRKMELELVTKQMIIQEQNRELMSSKTDKTTSNGDLNSNSSLFKSQVSTLKKQVSDLEQKNTTLSTELQETRKKTAEKTSQMRSQIENLKKKNEPVLQQEPKPVEQKSNFNEWLIDKKLKEKVATLSVDLKAKTEKLEKLEKTVQSSNEFIAKQRDEKQKLLRKLDEFANEEQEKKQLEEYKQIVADFIHNLNVKISHKKSSKSIPSNIQDLNQMLSQKLSDFLFAYEKIERLLHNEQLKKRNNSISNAANAQVAALESQVEELKTELRAKQEKIGNQLTYIHELKSSKALLLGKQTKIKSISSLLDEQSLKVSSLEQLLAEKDKEIQELKKQPVDQKILCEIACVRRENEILKQQVAKISADKIVDVMTRAQPKVNPEFEALRKENKELQAKIKSLDSDFKLQNEYQELEIMYKQSVKLNKEYERAFKLSSI